MTYMEEHQSKSKFNSQSNVARFEDFQKKRRGVAQHIGWDPEGWQVTSDQKAENLMQAFLEAENTMKDTVPIPVSVLTEISDTLYDLSLLTTATVREWGTMSEGEKLLRQKIAQILGVVPALAEQFLPEYMQVERRKDRMRKDGFRPATEFE